MATDYDILGLPSSAKKEDIKKAYRRLSLRYHPDRPDGNADKYLEIRGAYDHLMKPDTAKIHDQYQHRTTPYAHIDHVQCEADGDCVISISFANMIFAEVLGVLGGDYHWNLFSMNVGTLVISNKDLRRCGYKFTINFVSMTGHGVVHQFKFEDPRTKWEKFFDKIKNLW